MRTSIDSRRLSGILLPVLLLGLLLGSEVRGDEPSLPVPGPGSSRPWIFFDLGENSLVATPKDPQTGDITAVSWIRFMGDDGKVTDAHAYLAGLRAHGYPIGLLMNLPPEWGDSKLEQGNAWLAETDPVRKEQMALALTAAKVEVVNDYFEGHGPGDDLRQKPRWNDPLYASMDFAIFTRGAIFVPFFQRFRKPMDGPAHSPDQLFLYRQAMEMAARHGKKAIYQGADARDIAGARKAGMLVRQLPYSSDRPVQQKNYYLNETQIDRMAGR